VYLCVCGGGGDGGRQLFSLIVLDFGGGVM
jgi:hypothetical protein